MLQIGIYLVTLITIVFFRVDNLFSLSLIELNEKNIVYNINNKLDFYLDDSGKLSIIEIAALKEKVWQKGNEYNFGFTKKVLWVKCKVKNNSKNTRWVLSYNYYHIDKAELFYKNKNGLWANKKSGRSYLNSDKDISYTNHAFSIPDSENNTIYLRFESIYSMTFDFTIENEKSFNQSTLDHYLFYTIFLAPVLLIIIYNIFLFYLEKDKALLFFALFLLSYFYMVILDSGLLYFYLNTSLNFINHNSLSILFVHLSKTLFVRYYLKTYDYSKTIDNFFKIAVVIILLSLVAMPFIPPKLMIQFQDATTIPNMFLWLYSAYFVFKKGHKEAGYLILVWVITFPSILNIILLEHGFISYNFFAVNGPVSHLILYIIIVQFSTMKKLWIDKEAMLSQLIMIVKNNPLITFWINDKNRKYIYANDIAIEKLGLKDEGLSQDIQNFMSQKDNDKIDHLLEMNNQINNYEISFYDNHKMSHDGILSAYRFKYNNESTTLTNITGLLQFL